MDWYLVVFCFSELVVWLFFVGPLGVTIGVFEVFFMGGLGLWGLGLQGFRVQGLGFKVQSLGFRVRSDAPTPPSLAARC